MYGLSEMKIDGIGELWEGRLERDPMSDGFYLRFTDDLGVHSVDLGKVFESYVGLEIRVAVSSLDSLRQVMARLEPIAEGVGAVRLEDLKGRPGQGAD